MHTLDSAFISIGSPKRDLEKRIHIPVVYVGKKILVVVRGDIRQIEKLLRKLMEANKLIIKQVVSGNQNPIGETMRIREAHMPRLSHWRVREHRRIYLL